MNHQLAQAQAADGVASGALAALQARAVQLRSTISTDTILVRREVIAVYTSEGTTVSSPGVAAMLSVATSASQETKNEAAQVYSNVLSADLNQRLAAAKADQAALADTLRQEQAAQYLVRDTEPHLESQKLLLESNVTTAQAAKTALQVRIGSGSDGAGSGSSEPIQGTSLLTAGQMAGWYATQGFTNNTGVPITQVAQEYLDAGARLGIRGDVAFAQSILETGGFSVTSGANNFAGIGACDSCSQGYSFPSVAVGVEAQIELLRAYTDGSFTAAQVHGPAAYPYLDTLSVRGCCTTWTGLDGVWATGALYGERILGIYADMLAWSLEKH